MGDRATLAKAKMELEQLYLGVPDESVNLTFQDLAEVRQHGTINNAPENKNKTMEETISDKSTSSSSLAKLPSIDFNRSLQQASIFHNDQNHHNMHGHHMPAQEGHDQLWGPQGQIYDHHHHHGIRCFNGGDHRGGMGHGVGDQRSMMYDDISHVSGMSSVANYGVERGGRRRPGVPHSNICTVCSNYIYICRHRCLVCGRVYCRRCVSIGMGEMSEGRKCIQCLGRRFSQRYIHKAGNVGCCMGYRSVVKQQELKWAEKGPRGSGENRYGGNSMMTSRSRSPSVIGTPALATTRPHSPTNASSINPPSFVMTSPYSPYSPTNHHPMPF